MNDPVDQGRRHKQPVGQSPPSGHSALAYMSADSDFYHGHNEISTSPSRGAPMSAPSGNHIHIPDRPSVPTRSSTVPSPRDYDPKKPPSNDSSYPFPDDHNDTEVAYAHDHPTSDHGHSRSQALLTASRPTTPASSSNHNHLTSDTSDTSRRRRRSIASDSSLHSDSSANATGTQTPASTSHTTASISSTTCTACGKVMQGAFVRALGAVYHLNCFKCMDCGTVVASKFFPIDGTDGKQHPLCERDYFRRLNLICAKCGQALRGSYITACSKKFHVEHFTCSVCPTLFGPQDSYYEHEGDVFCHYHYSTRFATKCAGCNSAILKQFVEINRNSRDECWHPECYMINKFWNVKVVTRRPTSELLPPSDSADGEKEQPPVEPAHVEEERNETPASLRERQVRMEQQVYRIWTVLSAFEESSAACISDMLRQVSNGQYLEAIRMAEKFILHVEVLFATIDDLEFSFTRLNLKGMSHVREARMLCRKTVDLFTLLSHTQETGARRMGMTQELLALVTGLAHYLKILIRIALTGALKLEREYNVREAISSFLDKLHMLAIQGGNPSAKRMLKRSNGESYALEDQSNASTQGVTYGFTSLAPESAGESPFSPVSRDPSKANMVAQPTDWCAKCKGTVEEDCVRLGTFQRWHSHCVQCASCGKVAAVPLPKEVIQRMEEKEKEKEKERADGEGRDEKKDAPKLSTARRPPANVRSFTYEVDTMKDTPEFGRIPTVILCTDHAHAGCRAGFQTVSRLEQYAFLLNVALRRLFALLRNRGIVPATPAPVPQSDIEGGRDPYRDSTDINLLKSVHLDRKLSATARIPKRSTVVESPTGKIAHPADIQLRGEPPSFRPIQQTSQPLNKLAKVPLNMSPQFAPQFAGPSRPRPNAPGPIDLDGQTPIIRPSLGRNNTEVMIVDDSAPTSPTAGNDEQNLPGEDGITLADIPQIVEAAQAREQHRSLPRQNAIPFIAELSALELAIVKHCAVLALQRSPLRDQFDLDEILELVENKKPTFWNRVFRAGNDKKNVKKKAGVFGVPLEILAEREGADTLHGASRATLRVPSFIDDVVSAMRQMDMSIEGIFRKNGNIRRLKELTDAIDRDPSSVDLSTDNPVQLAALLKKFLRELPDPLMTFKLHRLLIASQSIPNEADRKRLLHMLSLILPKHHRDTMEVLFVFLKWVASFAHIDKETGSKMDLPNLATVICPSILYSRGRDAVRDESFGAIRVVTSLLENQDEFFCMPEEFLAITQDLEYFANSLDLPSKEFLKKCDSYMRSKSGARTPGLMSPVLGSSPFNTPRSEDMRSFPPRPPQSNPQLLERPPMGPSSMSDSQVRTQSRQQSPPAHPHPPYPPQVGVSAPSLSQGMATIQAPQPRSAINGSSEWGPQGQLPSRPSSARPQSFVTPPVRGSIDGPHPFALNGPNSSSSAAAARQRM